MSKTSYITSGNFRLMIYQSDILNATSSDPYVNVTVYFQVNSAYSGALIRPGAWTASMLSNTYTASGSQATPRTITWSGWRTFETVFSSKGIWSVSKTRTSFNVTFSMPSFSYIPDGASSYETDSVSLSGTVTMQAWPTSGTKDTASIPSSMTMGTAYTISITHKTSGNKNTLTYSFGGASGTIISNSTSTSVSFTPPTSLGAKIPSATSGTITFTLKTYNSSGTSLGSTTYTSKLNVPSYSLTAPTVSAAKNSYTGVGAYVANKTSTRFTLSGLPSGTYGATVTGSYEITLAGASQSTGTKTGTSSSTVDYVAAGAGALKLTYTIRDSRGKTASANASVTYVANQAPTIAFSVARSSSPTTSWSGTASGTYLNVSGNTATVTFSSGTAGTATVGSGSFSRPVSGTGLAETSSLTVKATITDTLGNTASISKTISTVFAYIEATPNKVIALGRKASTSESNKVQIGLPTYFDAGAYGIKHEQLDVNGNFTSGYDLNDATSNGLYTYNSSAANTPMNAGGTLFVARTSATYITQIAFSNYANALEYDYIYTRRYYSGTWTSWHRISDFVVDYGTSGDWKYRKWNSGVYECWCRRSASIAISSAWGQVYYGTLSAISYPVTFDSTPFEQVSVSGGSGIAWIAGYTQLPSTTTTGRYALFRPSTTTAQNYYIDYYVRGTVS